MYLFVFIYVILAVMGLYTELFTLRLAAGAGKQKAAAETMMVWHGGAVRYARDSVALVGAMATPAADGCSIGPLPSAGGFCTIGGSALSLPVGAVGAGPLVNRIYLPAGYSADARFDTRVYDDPSGSGQRYLVTYMPAGGVRLGFTTNQVYRQMFIADLPRISFGSVQANCPGQAGIGPWLVTTEMFNGNPICYRVPTGMISPTTLGAIGIISVL